MGLLSKCFSPPSSPKRDASSTHLPVQVMHPDPAASTKGSLAGSSNIQRLETLRSLPRALASKAWRLAHDNEAKNVANAEKLLNYNEMSLIFYGGIEVARSPYTKRLRENVQWWSGKGADKSFKRSAHLEGWRYITDAARVDSSGVDSIQTFYRLLCAFKHECQQMESAAQPGRRDRINGVLNAMSTDNVLCQHCLKMSTEAPIDGAVSLGGMLRALEQAVVEHRRN